MKLRMLDRILEIEPGVRIVAVKRLRAEEEYLKDHFPLFPVMPGVLMLEALFQAAMWLVRKSTPESIVLLKEVRNVKFADFVEPDQTLEVTAEVLKQDDSTTTCKVQGTVEGATAVSGKLILERFNLVDRYPENAALDPYVHRSMLAKLEELTSPSTPLETPVHD